MASPLETVALNHGAVMGMRHGRRVPARFSSAPTEEAVCVHAVGMADRSDRDTLELRGTSDAIEQAMAALDERAWSSFIAADRAIVRCEAEDAPSCLTLLADMPGVTVHDRTSAYAAIGLIGPRAAELLESTDLNPSGLVIQESRHAFEVILPADHGPSLWDFLLEAGAPFELACVGHDALDLLAASQRRAER